MKPYGPFALADPCTSGPTLQAAVVSPLTHVCAVPKSPFMPDPSAPTATATTNATSATRSAYCTVDAPRSECARPSNVPYALRNPRRAKSVTPFPSFTLVDHSSFSDYLASRGKCMPVMSPDGAAEKESRET